ncbi:MAG: hypothetical protein IPJ06_00140 [Saprospiraceae bacterium]|nr:hypothetical protein [Saprospiraceae bacterium]
MPDTLLPVVTVRDMFTPALYNDPELAGRAKQILIDLLGNEHVVDMEAQTIGEDFSRYGRQEPRIPSLMLRLGTARQDMVSSAGSHTLPGLHSPFYLPDAEQAIPLGIEVMSRLIGQLSLSE